MEDSSQITGASETPPHADGAEVPAPSPAAPPKPPSVGDLRRERKRLWDQREQSLYHVGGLAVDLRRRGIDDVELVNLRADGVLVIDARINEIDAILARVDTRRRGEPTLPAAGYCAGCGAPFQHEAAFCFRCGARVTVPAPPETAIDGDQPTDIIPASEIRP